MGDMGIREDLPGERWKPALGWEGLYEVSDQGRVFSCPRTVLRNGHPYRIAGKMLTLCKSKRGRMYTIFSRDGKTSTVWVHKLVLEAFVGPRPPGLECCHANDIGSDNRLENLRWDTHSSNQYDRARNGVDHNARKTHCPKGHEYTPENTYRSERRGTIMRSCKECNRIQSAEYRARMSS